VGRIGAKVGERVPILLTLIEEMNDQPDANGSRFFAAEAAERLTNEVDVLTTVDRHCLVDRFWQCRMRGLFMVERLLKRQPDLRERFVPLIEPLLKDRVEEIRRNVRRIKEGSVGFSN
jgi:hypothetical protein